MALSIELCAPHVEPCSCCAGQTTSLTRFVREAGEAHSVYLARFSESHPEKRMDVVVAIGGFGGERGDTIESRRAFALDVRIHDGKPAVMVIDGERSPWKEQVDLLGQFLSRAEALQHPWLPIVFGLTDRMVGQDPAIRAFLSLDA